MMSGLGLHLTRQTPLPATIWELLRRGDISQCSFRFIVGQDEWIYADESNGLKYDQRTIIKVSKLYDVALVVYPAYKDTEASVRHLEERKAEYLRSLRPDEQTAPREETGDPPAAPEQEEQPDKEAAVSSQSRDRLVTVMEIANK